MKTLKINTNNPGNPVFKRNEGYNIFNQLAVKIDMNHVDDTSYFSWLEQMIYEVPQSIHGVTFLEKVEVRANPPLNTAVYYDTQDYRLLPTGALLRTSCNIKTHAFCAFKLPEDKHGNRLDRRHVFEGHKKKTIQQAPYSEEAIQIVKELLSRSDIEHPGIFLKREFDITSEELFPAMVLFGNRSTFFVRIDDLDVLRCSLDRSKVMDFRNDPGGKNFQEFREVEISIYPRISSKIVDDPRVTLLIRYLVQSLVDTFSATVIYDIKYQRGCNKLGLS